MDHAMKRSTRRFHKTIFHISKFLACNAEKNITDEDNEYSYFYKYIYKYIYTYIICDKSDSKLK